MPLAQALNETTHMTDAKAFIAWLDQQASVAKNRKIGTQGYCMGGPIAFRTAAAVPDRVGAVASFHGGGLVTDTPNSPHLQAAKTKAQFLIAIAENDDKRSPNDKNVLKETFAKANLPAEIEVYAGARTAGARRIRGSTTSRRPRRPGAVCSRCTEKRWPEHRSPTAISGWCRATRTNLSRHGRTFDDVRPRLKRGARCRLDSAEKLFSLNLPCRRPGVEWR